MASLTDIRLDTAAGRSDRLRMIFARLRAYRERRAVFLRTRSELSRMSTRELADIGVTRSEIDRIARDAAA